MHVLGNVIKRVLTRNCTRANIHIGVPLIECTNTVDHFKVTKCTESAIYCRESHTDIKIPNFDEYRHNALKKPTARTSDSSNSRRVAAYMMSGLLGTGLAYGTKSHVLHYIYYMGISADMFALAKIEINLADVPEGVCNIFKWRGRPLFVWHRTPEMIKKELNQDLSLLIDPQDDRERCKNPEFLIAMAVCTHLGCVPNPNSGDFGGFLCPCHGAQYDGSGRVRRGPAPLNLSIPPYEFSDDGGTVIVG